MNINMQKLASETPLWLDYYSHFFVDSYNLKSILSPRISLFNNIRIKIIEVWTVWIAAGFIFFTSCFSKRCKFIFFKIVTI